MRVCAGHSDPPHMQILILSVGKIQVKVRLWDTYGAERFRTITTAYYRGADGVVIVYDVTDRSSFESSRSYFDDKDR